jgi:hypothetical protein
MNSRSFHGLSSGSETIFRLRGLPLCEKFVHLSLAGEIDPEKDRAGVAVGLSERAIGDKQSAIPA